MAHNNENADSTAPVINSTQDLEAQPSQPQGAAASSNVAASLAPRAAPIAVDDADVDEGLGSDTGSERVSLKSSVLNFEIENGRRYHAYSQGAYAFPNDEDELDRMDLEHHIFSMLLGGNYLAPLEKPQKILDLGTGTGIWAIEMADHFTSAHVIGIDLSPVQPQFVPPNCEFLVDDFEQEWTWQADSFDLIHSRLLLASVTDYAKLFQNAFRAVKSGGYIEMHDIDPSSYCDDGTLTAESAALRWGDLFKEGCAKAGRPILSLEQYKPLMEAAGFIDVKEYILLRPHNAWAKNKLLKRIGVYTLLNHVQGLHAFTIGIFTRVLGWSADEVEVFCTQCRNEWHNVELHGYQKVIAIYGRKR